MPAKVEIHIMPSNRDLCMQIASVLQKAGLDARFHSIPTARMFGRHSGANTLIIQAKAPEPVKKRYIGGVALDNKTVAAPWRTE